MLGRTAWFGVDVGGPGTSGRGTSELPTRCNLYVIDRHDGPKRVLLKLDLHGRGVHSYDFDVQRVSVFAQKLGGSAVARDVCSLHRGLCLLCPFECYFAICGPEPSAPLQHHHSLRVMVRLRLNAFATLVYDGYFLGFESHHSLYLYVQWAWYCTGHEAVCCASAALGDYH